MRVSCKSCIKWHNTVQHSAAYVKRMNIYLKSENDGASREGESEYWEWTNTTQNWRSEWKLKIVNYIIKTDSCLFLNQTNLLCWCSCRCCYYSFCYAYYIRGLCSFFLFPNAKYKIVSHFPLQPDAARYERMRTKNSILWWNRTPR